MIKCKCISHIEESLEYIEKDEKDHAFFDSYGVDTSSLKTILEDFSLFESPKIKNNYISLVISPNKLDNLDDEKLKQVLDQTIKNLDLGNRSYYSVKHRNTENTHIHVYLCRVSHDGETWNDSKTAWRCLDAGQKITREMNLIQYEVDLKKNKDRKGVNSKYNKEKQNCISELRQLVTDNLFKVISIDELFDKLESKGAQIKINELKNGKLGVSIIYKDLELKASEISRYLSVKKEDNYYVANNKLQEVINRNIDRFELRRGQVEIMRDINNYPERSEEFYLEYKHFNLFLINSFNTKSKDWEEQFAERMKKKFSKRNKQIGFKIQI